MADGNGNLTNLDYDGFDRLHRTFHAHASTGAVCTLVLPHTTAAPSCASGQTYEELGYDANGNVTFKRNRSGASIAFAFDALNREITRTVPLNALGHFLELSRFRGRFSVLVPNSRLLDVHRSYQ